MTPTSKARTTGKRQDIQTICNCLYATVRLELRSQTPAPSSILSFYRHSSQASLIRQRRLGLSYRPPPTLHRSWIRYRHSDRAVPKPNLATNIGLSFTPPLDTTTETVEPDALSRLAHLAKRLQSYLNVAGNCRCHHRLELPATSLRGQFRVALFVFQSTQFPIDSSNRLGAPSSFW